MGLLRGAVRRAIALVGRAVERDDLFEKPGERSPSAPLPARTDAKAAPAAVAPVVPPSAGAPSPTAGSARPREGCAPVDLAGLANALRPSGRPLVINHWATWCDPCVDEMPRLVRAAAGLGDVAEFIGVSWDLFDHPGAPAQVSKRVAAFADSVGIGYPSVLYTGTPESLFAACKLDYQLIPQTLILAPDGRVVYHHQGVIGDDDVIPLIKAARAAAGGES